MKRSLLLLGFALAVVALVVAFVVGGPGAALAAVKGVASVLSVAALPLLGLGAVVETISEDSTPSDHKVRDVSPKLTLKRPSRAPLMQTLRRLRKGPRAKAEKVEWEEDVEIPRLQLTSGTATAGGAGAVKVWTVLPNPEYLRVDDILYLPNNATAPGCLVLVTAVDTDVDVVRWDNGSTSAYGTVPALASGEKVVRLGNVKEEGFTHSKSRTTMPTTMYNYIEAGDGVVEITGRRANSENYTKDDLIRSIDQQLYDYESNWEYKLFFGKREKKGIAGKNRTSMGGILSYNLPKALTYDHTSFDEKDILSWMRQVFSGNSGSEIRYMHADPYLTEDLATIPLDKLQRTQHDSKTLKMGVTELEWEGMGKLRVIPEEVFAQAGKVRFGTILDYENLSLRHFRALTKKKRDLMEAEGRDAMAYVLYEELTLEVRYLETHATIQGT